MDNQDRMQRIRHCLSKALAPCSIELVDESHLHAGHPGARDGRGHFKVRILSQQFVGLNRMARHRLVYQALGPLMETDIHAINIEAKSENDL